MLEIVLIVAGDRKEGGKEEGREGGSEGGK